MEQAEPKARAELAEREARAELAELKCTKAEQKTTRVEQAALTSTRAKQMTTTESSQTASMAMTGQSEGSPAASLAVAKPAESS